MTSTEKTPGARPATIIELARAALAQPAIRAEAKAADALFRSYCTQSMPRIPGCDTQIRLAIRIDAGRTPIEAAAREYSYRWQLFLGVWLNHTESRSRSRFVHGAICYPAPHLLGQ